MKIYLLINTKMPTIVSIFIIISREKVHGSGWDSDRLKVSPKCFLFLFFFFFFCMCVFFFLCFFFCVFSFCFFFFFFFFFLFVCLFVYSAAHFKAVPLMKFIRVCITSVPKCFVIVVISSSIGASGRLCFVIWILPEKWIYISVVRI